MQNTPKEILDTYLYARRPLIYIHNFDFQAVDKIIAQAVDKIIAQADAAKNAEIAEFSEADGRVDFKTKLSIGSGGSLADFLKVFVSEDFTTNGTPYIVILKEIHESLANKDIYSLLQSIVQRVKLDSEAAEPSFELTIIIVDSKLAIPLELEKYVTLIDIKPPQEDEIKKIITDFTAREDAEGIQFNENQTNELLHNFAGLSEYEIKQILELALADVEIGPLMYEADKFPELIRLIHKEKRQAIKKSGLLEIIEVKQEQVGGLTNLRKYLDTNKAIFNNPALAEKYGVTPLPAGVMIVGMPGCGKSLTAKYIARQFNVPLLRLDVGKLLGKYVGESEDNLRRAIAIAEASAPCILWIDEIEKAFAGIGSSGGGEVTTRMFGYFLTWMQEKNSCIYVVATANDISNLPPEFLRRGRFDEIFQVEFPTKAERAEIFKIQIKKRIGELPSGIDCQILAGLLKDTDKFSGADIESIVKESLKRVFVDNMNKNPDNESKWRKLSMSDLKDVISETKSSYHSQRQKLDRMLDKLKELDVRSAS